MFNNKGPRRPFNKEMAPKFQKEVLDQLYQSSPFKQTKKDACPLQKLRYQDRIELEINEEVSVSDQTLLDTLSKSTDMSVLAEDENPLPKEIK